MNVTSIIQTLNDVAGKSSHSLVIQNDNSFRDSLTLGQVIKGKILRQYESGKYLVSFAGEEKIVDSSIPLKKNDTIQGRVIELGDKIHLQRIDAFSKNNELTDKAALNSALKISSADEKIIYQLFTRFNESLSAKNLVDIGKTLRGAANRELMTLSNLIVRKMGVTPDKEIINAIYNVLKRDKPALMQNDKAIPELAVDRSTQSGSNVETVHVIAQILQKISISDDFKDQLIEENKAQVESDVNNVALPKITGDDTSHKQGEKENPQLLLGSWLLNTQTNGAVSHRMITFPVWLDDRLVEVSMALFSQHKNDQLKNGIRYQKIVFSLETEHLGHVELSANVADKNLIINVKTENESTTNFLSQHISELRKTLLELGWNISELNYQTVEIGKTGEVVRSVVDHYINQGSLNQLI